MQDLERLSDEQLLDAAVSELARVTGLPVAFGGYHRDGGMTVTSISGSGTDSIEDLHVSVGRGLGGRAMVELRPRLTPDYEHSRQITHDYDREILDAGIVSLVAIPVVASGETRALLYGGTRAAGELSGLFQRHVAEIADALSRELRVRDEITRRAALSPAPAVEAGISAAQLEEVRASYAELRSAASQITDPEIRSRLAAVEERLARLGGATPGPDPETPRARLSPRELDVLSQVALGATNAEAGRTIGLTEGTVKSYLKTAMSKLGASSRFAAVATARRAGLIP